MEALDAHHQVEASIRERKEIARDDVRDSVWITRDVEPRDAGRRRKKIVVGPGAAEEIEDVDGSAAHPGKRHREIVEEPADVEVVELRRSRIPTCPPHPRDLVGRNGSSPQRVTPMRAVGHVCTSAIVRDHAAPRSPLPRARGLRRFAAPVAPRWLARSRSAKSRLRPSSSGTSGVQPSACEAR